MEFQMTQESILQMCHDVLFPGDPGGSGASGSGVHGANPPDSSSGESGEPVWLTTHKHDILSLSAEERKVLYQNAFSIVASTFLVLEEEDGDFHLTHETGEFEEELPGRWESFYSDLKDRIEEMFPGELSDTFASKGRSCLIKNCTFNADGPSVVREYGSPESRWNILSKKSSKDLLLDPKGVPKILTEDDPFFEFMGRSVREKTEDYFKRGALDWHMIVIATVFLTFENGGEVPGTLISREVAQAKEGGLFSPKKNTRNALGQFYLNTKKGSACSVM